MVRDLVGNGEFIEIFVDTPLDDLHGARSQGAYTKSALAGEIKNFTGIDQPYEAPEFPELRLEFSRALGRSHRGADYRLS